MGQVCQFLDWWPLTCLMTLGGHHKKKSQTPWRKDVGGGVQLGATRKLQSQHCAGGWHLDPLSTTICPWEDLTSRVVGSLRAENFNCPRKGSSSAWNSENISCSFYLHVLLTQSPALFLPRPQSCLPPWRPYFRQRHLVWCPAACMASVLRCFAPFPHF